MHEISRKGAVILGTIVSFAAALVTVVVIWKVGATANEVPLIKAIDKAPKWEFQSAKDELTDEIYTNMHLYAESGSALFSIRCEEMIDVNGANVPMYTLQIATSDYLGKTEYPGTRTVAYRLGAEHVVYEGWGYSDKNAEQVFPLLIPSEKRAAEILKRISVTKEIIDGKPFKIRVATYKYTYLDFAFEGRDPDGANEKLLAACVQRTLKQQR